MITYSNNISVEEYNALVKAVGWTERHTGQAQVGLSNSVSFVARVEGTPVGMTRIVTDGGYIALIVDMIVHPDYQGKGLGKTLMRMAMGYLRQRIPEGAFIYLNLMSAKGKDEFYKKLGFTERPCEIFGAGFTMVLKN